MSAEYFNSIGGFSAGWPPVPVVDSTGNVVTNVLTTGNVTANVIYGNVFRLSNGSPLTAGNNNQIQFNSNGTFAASTALTFDTTQQLLTTNNLTVTNNTLLGSASNVKIQGGVSGYFLQTDGTGNLSWAFAGGGGGNGSPSGANTQIQFNDAGLFGSNVGFTYDKETNLLTVGTANVISINANGISNLANVNVSGTLSSNKLTITGNTTVSSTGTLSVQGNVNFSSASNVTLGDVNNLHIGGGFNGFVLSTDGNGTLTWIASGGGGGGNGTPGGSNSQIQYNKYGTFGGDPFFTYNDVTETVQVGGTMIANTVQIGSGIYKYAKTTSVTTGTTTLTPNQVIYSTPTANLLGIDFSIIATNQSLNRRNTLKLSSQIYGNTVLFTETDGLYYNGIIGNFDITYNPGNILLDPSIELKVSPTTNLNQTLYKILITTFVS